MVRDHTMTVPHPTPNLSTPSNLAMLLERPLALTDSLERAGEERHRVPGLLNVLACVFVLPKTGPVSSVVCSQLAFERMPPSLRKNVPPSPSSRPIAPNLARGFGAVPGGEDIVLRHTWASHCILRGVHSRIVMMWGGWTSEAMLSRFAHLAPRDVESLINRIAPPRAALHIVTADQAPKPWHRHGTGGGAGSKTAR